MIRLIVFDFDGTLVDTITDVAICFNKALQYFGFPTHEIKEYDGFVGGNLETVVSKLLPADAVTEENIFKVKKVYRELYLQSEKNNTLPYPGIKQLVKKLCNAGYVLAVNSNKGQVLLDQLIEKLFPKSIFTSVMGYEEGHPCKPDPYGVQKILMECCYGTEDGIYVGDGKSDILTAKNAGMPICFVTWGQGSMEDAQTADFIASTVDELEEILMKEKKSIV